MKKIVLLSLPFVLIMSLISADVMAQKEKKKKKNKKKGKVEQTSNNSNIMKLENELDSVSYALGINLANNVKKSGMTKMNTDAMGTAISATLSGDTVLMTEEESGKILNDYFSRLQKEEAERLSKVGREWLAENATKSGVTTKPSGLQYKVLKSGTGKTPGATDKVTTHYHGTFIDGKIFDSSMDRGQPASFGVNQVIKGWTEALQLMKEGDEWELYIPYNLAYGEQGRPGIPPYSTLIFKINLISVDTGTTQPVPGQQQR